MSAPAARNKEAGASGEGRGVGSAPPERSSQVKANGGAAAIDPDIVAKRPGFLLGSVGQAVRAAGGSASGSAGAVALNEDEDDDDVGDLLVGEDEEDEDDFADEVEDAIMGMRTAQVKTLYSFLILVYSFTLHFTLRPPLYHPPSLFLDSSLNKSSFWTVLGIPGYSISFVVACRGAPRLCAPDAG